MRRPAATDADYNFISNEVFVIPSTAMGAHAARRWGVWPMRRRAPAPSFTLDDIEALLTSDDAIGAPDVVDAGMLQYLRTQRIDLRVPDPWI